MSDVGPEGRSFLKIRNSDLQKLAEFAKCDREEFFQNHPDWSSLYRDRFLCSALCQGAALHYVFGEAGINDFDIYNFYAHNPKRHWYAKRQRHFDYGDSKFGKTFGCLHFVGRRIDVWGRAVPAILPCDPAKALQEYLRAGSTKTAQLLSRKAVVLLEPLSRMGEIVWPINNQDKL